MNIDSYKSYIGMFKKLDRYGWDISVHWIIQLYQVAHDIKMFVLVKNRI